MFDIITFGSATWDIFIKPKRFQRVLDEKKFITGKGICFDLGLKIDVENIFFSSGGGGTNTAVAFAKQGFKVAFCGIIGNDLDGEKIISELKKSRVETKYIIKTNKRPTNHSIILRGKKERTIFAYRGASEMLKKKNIPWKKLKSKWFYLAPLSGNLCYNFESIVNFASKNKIKTAVNPGICQLSLSKEKIKKILKKVDILFLNQEEASFLTEVPYQKEKEIFKKIDELCPGIAVMTKGSKGAVVSDGKYLYRAGILNTRVIDKTGAGDSFASGFLTGFIKSKENIESALQLAIANSSFCLKEIGAKKGLLKKGEKFPKVKIKKRKL